jgi:hypothetical protein
LVPAGIREQYGVVLDKEVNVVLDAAGFAYSDQWGPDLSEELARSSKRWKKQGSKVILLPQAFGPFRDQVTLSLLGTGTRGVAIYAAVVMPVLFLFWTVAVATFGRRKAPGSKDPGPHT